MAYNSGVENFVNQVIKSNSIANPNRYWVEFTFPFMGDDFQVSDNTSETLLNVDNAAQVDNSFNRNGELSMMCSSVTMPGRRLNTSEHKHENYPITIPNSQAYDPVSLTFTLSANLKERKYFEYWQEVIVNTIDGTMNFYNEYVSTIRIYQLDKSNKVTYGVELREAYPIALSDINYSYASSNEILSCTVNMSYKYWNNIDYKSDYFFRKVSN